MYKIWITAEMDTTPLQFRCSRVQFLLETQSGTPATIHQFTMEPSASRIRVSCSRGRAYPRYRWYIVTFGKLIEKVLSLSLLVIIHGSFVTPTKPLIYPLDGIASLKTPRDLDLSICCHAFIWTKTSCTNLVSGTYSYALYTTNISIWARQLD